MAQEYEKFGKYILLSKIATGGMAELFLARAPQAEGVAKFVALKRILPQFATNPDFVRMFREEARTSVNLAHRNVVSIFEFDIIEGQPYLAMEYVDGKNLRQILNRLKEIDKKLPIPAAVHIINQVAQGLESAHRCVDRGTGKALNIIHRDISPQNFMISYEGDVKVVDFGIAKAEAQEEATRTGTLKGKFSYMSPEQADGEPLDSRTDIFSVGIVLWELLSGERLFASNNEMNILKKVRDCEIPPLRRLNEEVTEELERIVVKALSHDRELRYQSALDLHRDLNKYLNTNFPEYTSQDFSHFIHSLFAEEVQASRRMMQEFAESLRESVMEKTEIASSTRTNAPSLPPPQRPPITAPSTGNTNTMPDAPEGLIIDPSESSLGMATVTKPATDSTPVMPKMPSMPPKTTTYTPVPTASSGGGTNAGTNSGITITPTPTNTSTITLNSSSSSGASWLVYVALLAGIGFGVFKFFPNQVNTLKCKFAPGPSCHAALTQNETGEEAEEAASVSGPAILVTSDPPYAEVFVDGKSQHVFTPAQVRVPAGQIVKIRVKKEGYRQWETDHSATQSGGSLHARLNRAVYGYLTIKVPVSSAIIYIDGEKLNSLPPINRHMVPASPKVTIRAVDPLSGKSDEKIVAVKENSLTTVTLYPNR